MKITIQQACVSPDALPFDAAERKGMGHPDSLADLVADTFSRRYSAWCLRQFGIVPNHWVDKVNLVGAAAEVRFGGYEIRKPIDCYLFGKVTDQVGATPVPVEAIFHDAVSTVLSTALGGLRILDHVRLHVNNTRGVAVDHAAEFYLPTAPARLAGVLAEESVANDTVICVGTSRRGVAADLATRLESHITSTAFRHVFPAVGTDVKVMVVRVGTELDITTAIPFHPEMVPSWEAYQAVLGDVQATLSADLKRLLDQEPRAAGLTGVTLQLNTKDVPGRGYLAPFGTSLGKGDCGAVGRGNRYSGAIEPLRPASCEAAAGKNPIHHVGKIYTAVAAEAAQRILEDTGVYAEVTIAARNGGQLGSPAHVLVALDRDPGARTLTTIERIVRWSIDGAASFKDRFLATDPIARFRNGGPA
jgi:S-adenosylmethionine synthetase